MMMYTNQPFNRLTSLMLLVIFLFVTFFGNLAPAYAAASPEEALREQNIYIIADKATPIECMNYNGKVKKGYFAYFQAKNRNGYLTNYPCYCVIPDQLGVNNLGNSNATLTDTVASPRIYGAIMNGYPYNQPADLGLQTNKEAYYATRNVVWTLAGNWDYSLWKSDGTEQGNRVKAAMDSIYAASQKWMRIPVELECKLTSTGAAKEVDGYVEQTYTITANYDATHSVSVFLDNAPSSAQITDTANQTKSEFAVGEDFKVRVPKADASGVDFDVKLYVQAEDNAVYYAKTEQANMQDYYATFDPINTSFSNAAFTYGTVSEEPDTPATPNEPQAPVVEDGTVTVYKKDKSGKPLAGAVFKVLKDGAEIGSYGTDSAGKFSFPIDANTFIRAEVKDPHDGTLLEEYEPLENGTPHNTYSIIEVQAPYGYLLSEENNQTITTIANGEGGLQQNSFTVTFVNEPYGNLLIEKTDKDTNRYLEGAVFRVTYLPGEQDDYHFTTDVTTDGTGMASITGLKPGSYSIEEIKAPEHYILDSKKETITVSGGETTVYHGVNSHKPGIRIYKYDPNLDIPLSGAAFKIEGIDNNFSGEYQTDQSGYIVVEDLPAGSYKVTEVEAPAGYVVSGENPQIVELSPGQVSAQLVFENLKKAELQITKLDEDTGEAVAGTKFVVRGIDTTYRGEFTTGKDGKILLDHLHPGSYQITESAAAPEYSLDIGNDKSVELQAGEKTELVFYNQKLAILEILKVDKTHHKPLSGVTYTICEKGGTVIGDYTTDKDGRIYLDSLEEGWYTITEKAVPDGVILDNTPKDVYVKKGEIVSVQYENSVKPNLTIQKVDSITKDVLSGAKFQVWYVENGSADGNLQELGTFTTNDSGEIFFEHVEPGWYRLKEVSVPSGYELASPDSKDVFMRADEDQTITFENTPKSAIVIKKVDADTGKVLEGAHFRVRYLGGTSGTGGTVIGEYETTSNGTVVITGLKAGTYVVEEISAPDGYVINDAAKTVYLSGKDQDGITVTFGDDKKGSLLVVKKDAVTDEPLEDVEFQVTNSDGGFIGTSNGKYVTDSAGTIRIDNLEPGMTVIVKETRAIPGYVLDDTPQSIKIKANETMQLEFLNQPKGGLVIVKKDAVTGEALKGVEFKITTSDGTLVPDAEGAISSNGIYYTDENGQILLENLNPDTYVVTETKTLDGYVLDSTPQTIRVNENDLQTLTFTNMPEGGLTIVKKDANTGNRLEGVRFEVQKMKGEVLGTFTTDRNGLIQLPDLEAGWYTVTELKAAKGYRLDSTPQKVEVKNGETVTLELENRKAASILIHKVDSESGDGIYGVKFLLYDASRNPIGEFTSDQDGYVYIHKELTAGKYFLRELEAADGYDLDETWKTVYVESGKTTEITWENTGECGQIQIVKRSALDNSLNGIPKGTLLAGAVFEIRSYKTGDVVDTIKTGTDGRAVSKTLPLGRYLVNEVKAPDYYGINPNTIDCTIEFHNQILRYEVTDEPLETGVSITKRGYYQVMAGGMVEYTFSEIANTSTVPLESFYWRDSISKDMRLQKIITGTYNKKQNYKIVYKTNRNPQYRTIADNLSTDRNRVLDVSPLALGLAGNEYVTEVMFVFGTVQPGFAQVEQPKISMTVNAVVSNPAGVLNQADVGGVYQGEWIQGVDRWITTVYQPLPYKLPRTGY